MECKSVFCVNGPRGPIKEFLPNETSRAHFSEFLFLSRGQQGDEGSSGTVPCLTSSSHTYACIRYLRTQNATLKPAEESNDTRELNLTPAFSDSCESSESSVFICDYIHSVLRANMSESQLQNAFRLSLDLSSDAVPVRSLVFSVMCRSIVSRPTLRPCLKHENVFCVISEHTVISEIRCEICCVF